MTLKIDRAGRIVVPKAVRDRLGLTAGTDLEMRETADGVVLNPVMRRPSLKRVGRFLVHTAAAPGGFDVVRSIADDREERIRKLAGL